MDAPRVLLIGDDDEHLSLLIGILADDAYPYLCGRSLLDVERHLEKGDVDIVLIDRPESIAVLSASSVGEVRQALRLGAFAALPKPIGDPGQIREMLRRVEETVRSPDLRELRANGAVLERLARCSNELASELFALYSSSKARGVSLDLGTVQSVSASVAARLFSPRETLLLLYQVREQCLRGRSRRAIEIHLSLDEARRVAAVGGTHLLLERLRHELGNNDLLIMPFGHTIDWFGLLVVLGSAEHPLLRTDAELLRRFGDFLSVSLAGAQLYKELFELSAVDALTGLYNHRFFQERLRDEVARAVRYNHPVSLLFCDIDDFKLYNDRNGHLAGDEVLAMLGQLLRSSAGRQTLIAFRESDVRARYGGEEFTVILPETTIENAVAKAERLRAAVADTAFPGAGGQPHGRLTISIGISEFPRHASDNQRLVEIADQAMYRAKQLGKNRVVLP